MRTSRPASLRPLQRAAMPRSVLSGIFWLFVVCGRDSPDWAPLEPNAQPSHGARGESIGPCVRVPRGCDRKATRTDIGLPYVVVWQHD
ncbi:hypothetical protein GQ607_007626, partial [Colletotrichum asianum]